MKHLVYIIPVIALLCIGATYEERFELMRKQGEAEIQRRHELALEEKRMEVIARLEQLGSDEINVYSSSSTEVVTEGASVTSTLTNTGNNTNSNTNTHTQSIGNNNTF